MCIATEIPEQTGKRLKTPSTPSSRRPVYPISVAAELAGVHPRTLYMYEKQQLLIPARRGTWRFYSEDDLAWIRVIRYLLHEGGVNIAGLQRLLALIPCTEIRKLGAERCDACPMTRTKSMPCWAVSATRSDRRCHECEVYQTARHWVCTEQELEQSELDAST
jgi:MerR family transcriptional regulator/heat shock protein HspR